MVFPSAQSSFKSSLNSILALGSMPDVGSSKTRSFGSWIMARARQSLCFIPWTGCPQRIPLFPRVLPVPEALCTALSPQGRRVRSRRRKSPCIPRLLSCRKVRIHPAHSRTHFSPARCQRNASFPPIMTVPSSAFRSPVIMRIAVVFPAPFGPTKP